MAKRDDLRRRRKAADRRRLRSGQPASDPPPPNPHAAASGRRDVVSRVVAEILAAADTQRQPRDAAALQALRGCVRLLPPSDPPARALYDRLQQIVAAGEASQPELRRAADQLLEIARGQSGIGGQGDDFLRYLAVLSR